MKTFIAILLASYLGYVGYINCKPQKQISRPEDVPAIVVEVAPLLPAIPPAVSPVVSVKEPEPKPQAPSYNGLYLIVAKSIETDGGITGIRPGTKIERIGLNRYSAGIGIEFVAAKDEVTSDWTIAEKYLEIAPEPTPEEIASVVEDTPITQSPVATNNKPAFQPTSSGALNKKSYNQVDFGLKDRTGNRLPFRK